MTDFRGHPNTLVKPTKATNDALDPGYPQEGPL